MPTDPAALLREQCPVDCNPGGRGCCAFCTAAEEVDALRQQWEGTLSGAHQARAEAAELALRWRQLVPFVCLACGGKFGTDEAAAREIEALRQRAEKAEASVAALKAEQASEWQELVRIALAQEPTE